MYLLNWASGDRVYLLNRASGDHVYRSDDLKMLLWRLLDSVSGQCSADSIRKKKFFKNIFNFLLGLARCLRTSVMNMLNGGYYDITPICGLDVL